MIKISKLSRIIKKSRFLPLVVVFCFFSMTVYGQPLQTVSGYDQKIAQTEGYPLVKGALLEQEYKILHRETSGIKDKINFFEGRLERMKKLASQTETDQALASEIISLQKEKEYLGDLLKENLKKIQKLETELKRVKSAEAGPRWGFSITEKEVVDYPFKGEAEDIEGLRERRQLREESIQLKGAFDEYKMSVKNALEKLKRAEAKNKEYARKITDLERKVEESIVPLRIEVATLNKEIKDLEAKLSRTEKDRDGWVSQVKTIQNTVDALKGDKRSLAFEANELEKKVRSLRGFEKEKARYDERIKRMEMEVAEQKALLREKEVSLKSRRDDLVRLESEKRKYQARQRPLEEEIKRKKTEIGSLGRDLSALKSEKQSLESLLKESRRAEERRGKEITALQEKITRLILEKDEFVQEVKKLGMELNQLQKVKSENESLQKELKRSQERITRIQEDKNGLMQEVKDLSGRLSEIPKLTTEKEALAKRVEQLEAKAKGYEEALDKRLRELEDYRKSSVRLKQELEAQKVSVADVDRLRSEKLSAESKIVNLENSLRLLEAKAKEYEKLLGARSADVERLRKVTDEQAQELKGRKEEIAKVYDEMDSLKTVKKELETEADGLRKTLDLVKGRQKSQNLVYESRIGELEAKVKEYEELLKRRGKEVEEIGGESQQLENKIRNLEAELSGYKDLLGKRDTKASRLEKEVSLLDQQLTENRASLNRALKDLAEARRKEEDAQRKVGALQKRTESLDKQLKAERKRKTMSTEGLQKELQKASTTAQEYKSALDKTIDELERIRRQNQEYESQVNQLQATIESLRVKLKDLEKANESYARETSSLTKLMDSLEKIEAENKKYLVQIKSLQKSKEEYRENFTIQKEEADQLNSRVKTQDETIRFLEKSLQYLQVEYDELSKGSREIKEKCDQEIAVLTAENEHLRILLDQIE
ncbi:MAG: hypothetical protein JSW17_04110 [Candidatus Omnitrophota bacterium]|nr:MAG: hypothetical protein JSW17_04110 [Candidatus Omnitrophota bacterium]